MSILSAALTLFLVMDPIGNVATFAAVLRHVDEARQRTVILRETGFALVALVLFLLCGPALLGLLHIEPAALYISGGIVLFMLAIRMVMPPPEGPMPLDERDEEPFIVPLAIPLLVGPSALATVSLLASQEPHRRLDWLVAVVVAWTASTTILLLSPVMKRALGLRGLTAVQRLMGMLLTVVAVQMFLTGVASFLAAHRAMS